MELPHSHTSSKDLPLTSAATTPDISVVAEPETTKCSATTVPTKRMLAVVEENDENSPVPKKLYMGNMPETEASPEATVDAAGHAIDRNDTSSKVPMVRTKAVSPMSESKLGIDELAGPEKPNRRPKTRLKVPPKKSRACDTCKKRKVKCRHQVVEQGDGGTQIPTSMPSLQNVPADKENATSPTQATDEVGIPETGTPAQATTQTDDVNNHNVPGKEIPHDKSKAKKKATPTKIRAPPERTSTRKRKAHERFEDMEEHAPAKTPLAKKSTSKVFDPVYITTNSSSRLGKADMYHMLLEDAAWTSLSAEQQVTLVSMLPDTADTQRLLAKINAGDTEHTRPQMLEANVCLRTEVAKFQADLKNGHLAKTWQTAAEQAVIERAAGGYDAWKAEEAELWWGQKSN